MSKIIALLITIALVIFVGFGFFYPPPRPDLGSTLYADEQQIYCQKGARAGATGFTDELTSRRGIRYHVRTPKNYNPQLGHPLLMVYAPGDRGALGTERFTGLTTEATSAGFIVAYADNRPKTAPSSYRPITTEWIMELGRIPDLIAKRWCIDKSRIYLAGHSNGATVTTALTILKDSPLDPSALIISGAGWTKENFEKYACPKPRPVMIMHSSNDRTFPGYGLHSAKFWSSCNRCDDVPKRRADGCMVYSGCTAATLYCEGSAPHTSWPKHSDAIIKFLYKNNLK